MYLKGAIDHAKKECTESTFTLNTGGIDLNMGNTTFPSESKCGRVMKSRSDSPNTNNTSCGHIQGAGLSNQAEAVCTNIHQISNKSSPGRQASSLRPWKRIERNEV